MKINEKNLINFACSKSYIDREGWLGKRGEVNKSFQKRWFVLKGNLLFYFEKRDDKEPVGLIILEGCTVELAENEEIYAFKLVFHGAGNRTYILCAKSQENMEQWMKALASASYDYVKLMVGELQRQLDEVTEMEKQAVSSVPNRLKGSKIPSNRSDGCLFGHAATGGRAPRFNPFDKWKNDGSTEGGANPGGATIATASSEDDLLHHSAGNRIKGSRQRYLFLELHEYYGQIFRPIFKEQKAKRAALKASAEQDLISFS
ncbi:sesquipedalian-1 [Trichonephila clavipes]|uniref:Sesquipedalian-1 n=1 Tax=Trichonephila inaurata madagascariensis TaxID=2747483 RepID=A0A8X7C1E2_9ARAC|nr:sesquipedalian-1 [Trichonephila clavipes]GFY48435.1 sesquipedalian-1 [Trichonephila inaurata madagascariensis]GFY50297.1 sesquipedalian-1 [Trichonephila inaurata madagascariensis]